MKYFAGVYLGHTLVAPRFDSYVEKGMEHQMPQEPAKHLDICWVLTWAHVPLAFWQVWIGRFFCFASPCASGSAWAFQGVACLR